MERAPELTPDVRDIRNDNSQLNSLSFWGNHMKTRWCFSFRLAPTSEESRGEAVERAYPAALCVAGKAHLKPTPSALKAASGRRALHSQARPDGEKAKCPRSFSRVCL